MSNNQELTHSYTKQLLLKSKGEVTKATNTWMQDNASIIFFFSTQASPKDE